MKNTYSQNQSNENYAEQYQEIKKHIRRLLDFNSPDCFMKTIRGGVELQLFTKQDIEFLQLIHRYISNIDNVINNDQGHSFNDQENNAILQTLDILITKTTNNMKKESSEKLIKIFQILNFARTNISKFNQLFDIILTDNN